MDNLAPGACALVKGRKDGLRESISGAPGVSPGEELAFQSPSGSVGVSQHPSMMMVSLSKSADCWIVSLHLLPKPVELFKVHSFI